MSFFSGIINYFRGKSEKRVLILGNDASGKTTLLYRLKLPNDPPITTIPTIGFNVESVEFSNTTFTMVSCKPFSLPPLLPTSTSVNLNLHGFPSIFFSGTLAGATRFGRCGATTLPTPTRSST